MHDGRFTAPFQLDGGGLLVRPVAASYEPQRDLASVRTQAWATSQIAPFAPYVVGLGRVTITRRHDLECGRCATWWRGWPSPRAPRCTAARRTRRLHRRCNRLRTAGAPSVIGDAKWFSCGRLSVCLDPLQHTRAHDRRARHRGDLDAMDAHLRRGRSRRHPRAPRSPRWASALRRRRRRSTTWSRSPRHGRRQPSRDRTPCRGACRPASTRSVDLSGNSRSSRRRANDAPRAADRAPPSGVLRAVSRTTDHQHHCVDPREVRTLVASTGSGRLGLTAPARTPGKPRSSRGRDVTSEPSMPDLDGRSSRATRRPRFHPAAGASSSSGAPPSPR